MSALSLDDLLARARHQVGTRRPNSAIIAQLTSGKERERRVLANGPDGEENPEIFDNVQSSNAGYDLILHVAVDFTRGGIGIGILQQIEIAGTGKVAPYGFQAPIVKLGYHGEDLRQEKVETREQAQIFALSQAVLLARDTIRDRWPCDVELRKVKLRVGLTGEESGSSRHCVAGLVSDYVRRWSSTGECFAKGIAPAGAKRVAKQVERLKLELSKCLNGCTGPVCFEDGEERMDVHNAARQKLKGLQASPPWKGRRQRTAPITSGRKRIHEIVQEYRAQHDTMQ